MAEQSNPGQKALIIGIAAALIGAGLGAYVQFGSETQKPHTTISGESVQASTLLQKAVDVKKFLTQVRKMKDYAPKGQMIDGKPRVTPLFFAPELWEVTFDADSQNRIIDIYDPNAAKIHDPINNLWFIQHGLAPELGRADGATVDSDGDGFSNIEEFHASTHPKDASSYPSLVAANKAPKLVIRGINTTGAVIVVDGNLRYAAEAPEEVSIRIFAKLSDTSDVGSHLVKKGAKFGLNDKDKDRFTLIDFEKHDYVDVSGNPEAEMAVKIQDRDAPVGAQEIVVRSGKPKVNDKDAGTPNFKGLIIRDTVVAFEVTAGADKGTDKARFSVPRYSQFTIPGDSATLYVIESIDRNGSVNIRPVEGGGSVINIPKVLLNKKTPKERKNN